MKRLIPTLFALFFVLSSYSQNNSVNPQSPVGTKVVIDALDYTNAINKYYFNKDIMDQLANFLVINKHISIEVNCFSDFEEVHEYKNN